MRVRLILLLLLLGGAPAQGWEVYVNNKPFKGEVLGGATDLMLAAEPLQAMVELEITVGGEGATVDGKPIRSERRDGTLFLDARQVAEISGGRYLVNKELGSIDVYVMGGKPAQGPGQNTYLIVKSEPGDNIGQGVEWKLFDNCSFDVGTNDYYYTSSSYTREVNVTVRTPDGHRWRLRFAAPRSASTLAVGYYGDATDDSGGGFPRLEISADDRSDFDQWGAFEVLDIAFSKKGPTRLAIDFSLHAKGAPQKKLLAGKLRYKTSVP